MNRYSLFILCVLLGLPAAGVAGPGGLRGAVSDFETGEPVIGAVVKAGGSFTTTGGDGSFRLEVKARADSVTFRSLGYETLTLPVTADLSDVRLTPRVTRLRDVVVRAPDIYARGDTLVFNVDRYATAADDAIIDVIKRLPGIRVEDDGSIKYQGKPISRLYLDGNDILGGQYGLATNNLSAKDVKSVEVMENHQPVKALEGIEFPEEAGINLRLKEDARGRWVGVAQAAGGAAPLLWDGSLFAMRIAPKVQGMLTLKVGNTGWDPATQVTEHESDDMFENGYLQSLWPEYISADMVSTPLPEKRTRDSKSWLANAISAWRSGDTSMRLKLNYAGDMLDYRSATVTDYLTQDIPSFTQLDRLHTRSHDLSAQFDSETNKRGLFLKDRLSLSAAWDNSRSAITGSRELMQHVSRRNLAAVNDLRLVKRTDTRLFTLTSRNSLFHNPDRLMITDGDEVAQRIAATDFRSTTETRLGRMWRFWKLYATAGADIGYRRMDAALSGMGRYDNDGIHLIFQSGLYASPRLDYERGGWRLSAGMPLKWLHHSVNGRHDYICVSPRLYAHRQLTSKSRLSASAAFALGAPQAYLELSVPVMSDYRDMLIPNSAGKYNNSVSASLSYEYRNPLNALFVNASWSYGHHRSPTMTDQRFIDNLVVTTYTDKISATDIWSCKGGISKGLGHSRMTIGCDLSASASTASSMRDGAVIPYRQLAASAKPYFKGSLARWLSVNYEGHYSFSKLKMGAESSDYHTLTQNLAATLTLCDRLHLTAGAEHFLTHFPGGYTAGLTLLDASATYRPADRIRLTLSASNLLDSRRYRYMNYGTLSAEEHTFAIRGRNILASVQVCF